jgi:methylated-DNA-protein-cysteine methyltransferase related protein
MSNRTKPLRKPARPKQPDAKMLRRMLAEIVPPEDARDSAIRRVIASIPKGKVATYGQVAAAAGFSLRHRLVARILQRAGGSLPWQRVVGSGGEIKLRGGAALEQRMRLEMEGVRFLGKRVDMDRHQHTFRPWEG